MEKYYNGGKILNKKDINGNVPELFLVSGNRSSGKTTYFSRKIVKEFIKNQKQFVLLYRFNYQTENCEDSFFGNLSTFFPDYSMTAKNRMRGAYRELFLNGATCGYAIALNKADVIKTISSMFYNVDSILFDEIQSESNLYCENEINKFISVHTSIARGKGKQSRYVPVYMLSNQASLLNPYFSTLGISERLRSDTKFLRGPGWVLEINKNEHAIQEQKASAFMSAFRDTDYYKHSIDNMYLNDNITFIDNVTGNNKYIATIKYKNKLYSIREYQNPNIIYISNLIDIKNPNKIAVTSDDHNEIYLLKNNYAYFITMLRNYYSIGHIRFQSLESKNAFIRFISY